MAKFIKTTNGIWVNPRYIVSMTLSSDGLYKIMVVAHDSKVEPTMMYIEPDEAVKLKSE